MDNCNCSCQTNELNMVDTNAQANKECPKAQCINNRIDNIGGIGGIDSSLLFFFLILVCIVCQSDCGISMDTLLWFFLLLVVIYNQYNL